MGRKKKGHGSQQGQQEQAERGQPSHERSLPTDVAQQPLAETETSVHKHTQPAHSADVEQKSQPEQLQVEKKGRRAEEQQKEEDLEAKPQPQQQQSGKKGRKQRQQQKLEEEHEKPATEQEQQQQQQQQQLQQQGGKKGRKQKQQQEQEKSDQTKKQLPEQQITEQQEPQQGRRKKKGQGHQRVTEGSISATELPDTSSSTQQTPVWPGRSVAPQVQQPPSVWGQKAQSQQPLQAQPSQFRQPPPQQLVQSQPQHPRQPPLQQPRQQPIEQFRQPAPQQYVQPPPQSRAWQGQQQRPAWQTPQAPPQLQQPHQQQRAVQREPQSQAGTPSTPGSSPYSVTPSSSTSSISQMRDLQIGDTLQGIQKMSIQSGQQISSKPPRVVSAGGDASVSKILPQTTVERRGGTEFKRKTTVLTNYFPLNIGKLPRAIHYDVSINPDRPKKLFRTAVEEFRKKRYSDRWPAYDGNKNLYSAFPLFDSNEVSDTVTVMDDDRKRDFTITIKFATYVDLSCLQNYTQRFRGRHILDMDKPMQALQCIDVVLRSAPALSCIPVGRSYFTPPEQKYALGDGCILYHGFYQAAILGWKPFVNIDVAHKAFPNSINMVDLVREMCPRADLSKELNPYDRDVINRHVKQLKIEYQLPKNPASRRVYRVNQLEASPVKATFTEDGGRKMTVDKYFQEKKGIPLRYPYLPTLWVGSKTRENRILLPFELCTILPDQAVNKKMTEQQTRNMIKQAATDTSTRLKNIERSVQKAEYNKSNTMREFGISVNPKPQEVEARILHPPVLKYKNQKAENVFKGTWRAQHFWSGAKLEKWSILCLDERTRDDGLQKLAQQLVQSAPAFGMEINQPQPPTRLRDRNLAADLQQYFSQHKNYQMVVVVLSNRSDCYNYVKRASEIAVGCLTQCVKPNTVYRLNRSTVENILLKINAKRNGINHGIMDVPQCLRKPFMIMGADVTHPGPDSRDFPSVAAVTASIDSTAFKYSFEWRLQPSRQEMIEDLEEITRQHLLYFYKRNNQIKPEKILYVRDGVSDGQFVQVLNVELMAIRAACQKLERNYKPSVIFIVVQKRHHTRFFPKDPSISEDRNMNVPAGTCVDTDITHPSIVDFYLVSHASIQGVAKPTKYVKLWDDCDMSEDEIEKLMYYLCHMFARCNRSVSYPAPTYYAHLAAARARVYCEIERIDMNNLQREQSRLTIKENISKELPMFFV